MYLYCTKVYSMATTNSNHYSLYDTNNYKNELTNTIGDIVNKYNVLLIEYLKFIHENSQCISSTKYNKFIIERGLETITHVFILILYYSNKLVHTSLNKYCCYLNRIYSRHLSLR